MMVVWIKLSVVNWWEMVEFWMYFIGNDVYRGFYGDWGMLGEVSGFKFGDFSWFCYSLYGLIVVL